MEHKQENESKTPGIDVVVSGDPEKYPAILPMAFQFRTGKPTEGGGFLVSVAAAPHVALLGGRLDIPFTCDSHTAAAVRREYWDRLQELIHLPTLATFAPFRLRERVGCRSCSGSRIATVCRTIEQPAKVTGPCLVFRPRLLRCPDCDGERATFAAETLKHGPRWFAVSIVDDVTRLIDQSGRNTMALELIEAPPQCSREFGGDDDHSNEWDCDLNHRSTYVLRLRSSSVIGLVGPYRNPGAVTIPLEPLP